MKKRIIGSMVLAAALCGGPAFAAQNTGNTSQKGSLLIFPLINVDPENTADTLIEVSNDNTKQVHVECTYVNELKGRAGFDFELTPKATASWDVLTGVGNIAAALFPSNGTFPAPSPPNPAFRGELICFAVDVGRQHQIAFNHLTGTATVVNFFDGDASQAKNGFRYNAWSFVARGASGPARDHTIQGTAGNLQLTGGGAGTYDACPAYNIASFNPNGAILGGVTTIDNDLSGVSCNQDLRQAFQINTTKLVFTVWNANENSLTGSYECVDSVFVVGLSAGDNPNLVIPSNFDFSTVQTPNARFQVQGVGDTTICPNPPFANNTNAGLLGVLTSSISLGDPAEDQEVGSTTQTAGADTTGFVLWDPVIGPPPPVK